MECDICGAILGYGRPFVGLNRWAVSVEGTIRMMQKDTRKGYVWDPDNSRGGILPLCWPQCASMYIDAQIIELEYEKRHGRA